MLLSLKELSVVSTLAAFNLRSLYSLILEAVALDYVLPAEFYENLQIV
jgi:hypothetical protein